MRGKLEVSVHYWRIKRLDVLLSHDFRPERSQSLRGIGVRLVLSREERVNVRVDYALI